MMDNYNMTPSRPFFFRAYYDWIIDNQLTPYIIVDTTVFGVIVPKEYENNRQLTLNISPNSVGQYFADNHRIEFNARFGGTPHHIVIPMPALIAIYAKENSVGMEFEPEEQYEKEEIELQQKQNKPNPFRVVK